MAGTPGVEGVQAQVKLMLSAACTPAHGALKFSQVPMDTGRI
jgi:hypothetical protein